MLWDLIGDCGNCSGILLPVLILRIAPPFLLVVALSLIFMSTSSNAAPTGVLSFSAGLSPLPRSTMSLFFFFLLVIFRQWLAFSLLPGGTVRGGSAHYCEKADLISGFIAVWFLFRVGFHRLWNYVLTFESENVRMGGSREDRKKGFSPFYRHFKGEFMRQSVV